MDAVCTVQGMRGAEESWPGMEVVRDFDELGGADQELWLAHRQLLSAMPRFAVGNRGCIGLGMSANTLAITEYDATRIFVPDDGVIWYAMQDVPIGKWATSLNREVHLASIRRTGFRYGMPYLGELLHQFDFRRRPYDAKQHGDAIHVSNEECLKPSKFEQAFRAFNAIEWAMTSTAYFYRTTWMSKVDEFYKAVGLERNGKRQLLYGQGVFDDSPPPTHWLPQPYLGFPIANAAKLYDASTKLGLAATQRTYGVSFKQMLLDDVEAGMPVPSPIRGRVVAIEKGKFEGMPCKYVVVRDVDEPEDLSDPENPKMAHVGTGQSCRQPVLKGFKARVRIGDTVARGGCLGWDGPEVPEGFGRRSLYAKWYEILPKLFNGSVEVVIRMWFERQHVRLTPGYLHMPAALTAAAAMTLSDETQLYWNIAPAMNYYNEPLETFVFPCVRQGLWNEFRIDLLPELEMDVRLNQDHRFWDWPMDSIRVGERRRGEGKTVREKEKGKSRDRRRQKAVQKATRQKEPAVAAN